MKRQTGISLIEILLSLFLSTLLATAVINIYLSLISHIKYQQAHMDMNQKARYITYYLLKLFHRAGNYGCIKGTGIELIRKDKIVVKYMASPHWKLRQNMHNHHTLIVPKDAKLATNIVISDCLSMQQVDISRQIKYQDKLRISTQQELNKKYKLGTLVSNLQKVTLSLRNNSLYVKHNNSPAVAIIDGIQELNFVVEKKLLKISLILKQQKWQKDWSIVVNIS